MCSASPALEADGCSVRHDLGAPALRSDTGSPCSHRQCPPHRAVPSSVRQPCDQAMFVRCWAAPLMSIDRTMFFALVATIAAGCPSPGAVPTVSAPVVGSEDGRRPAAPAAAGASAPRAADELDPSPCDALLIGPCGEGNGLADSCSAIASSMSPAERSTYLACVKSDVTVAVADPACVEPAASCARNKLRCANLLDQQWTCEENAARNCKAITAMADACAPEARRACVVPERCTAPIARACEAGGPMLDRCRVKAKGE